MSEVRSWEELRKTVKNCGFTECPRNQGKLPILFDRTEESLSRIRFVVVSQEPASGLENLHPHNTEEIEKFLVKQCSGQEKTRKGNIPYFLIDLFGGYFNPARDEIYWTHSLKCIPTRNRDINNQWGKCSKVCSQHFRNELSLILERCQEKPLNVIAIGRYALTLCRRPDEPNRIERIKEYLRETDPSGERLYFQGKEMLLFAFIHPSKREAILKKCEYREKIEEKERQFKEKIGRILRKAN
jgi:hypothetical protein